MLFILLSNLIHGRDPKVFVSCGEWSFLIYIEPSLSGDMISSLLNLEKLIYCACMCRIWLGERDLLFVMYSLNILKDQVFGSLKKNVMLSMLPFFIMVTVCEQCFSLDIIAYLLTNTL